MPDHQKPTYLESIQNRFKNNPVIAWLIVAMSILLTISTLIPATESLLIQLNIWEKEPPLNITLEAYDPRFGEYQENGRRTNWGGGSQQLFVETTKPIELPTVPHDKSGHEIDGIYEFTTGLLDRLTTENAIKDVWEVIPRGLWADGMRIKVNVVYDSAKDEPTCVVLEWGVLLEKTAIPSKGLFLTYKLGGGAYGQPTGGEVRIGESEGMYQITIWLNEDSKKWDSKRETYVDVFDESERPTTKPKELVQYLNPGEPAFLNINVTATGEEPLIHDPRPDIARIVKVYARILVKGKEFVIQSKNSVRAVVLNGWNDWQLEDDGKVEDFRHQAYISR